MGNPKKDLKDISLEEITEVFMDTDAQSTRVDGQEDDLDMDELREKIKSGEVTVKFAPQLHINDLDPWVREVLKALDMEHAFVTDMSSISDFGFELDEIELAADRLGIEVSERDYIYSIAQRLKDSKE